MNEINEHAVCFYMLENEPKKFNYAMNFVDFGFWKEVVYSELDSIKFNYTWELVNFSQKKDEIVHPKRPHTPITWFLTNVDNYSKANRLVANRSLKGRFKTRLVHS